MFVLFVSCESRYPIALGNGYVLETDSWRSVCVLNSKSTVIVEPNIIAYAIEGDFILAITKPFFLLLDQAISLNITKHDEIKTYIRKSNLRDYWIVNKKTGQVFKFSGKKEFREKCSKIGIPESTRLQWVAAEQL